MLEHKSELINLCPIYFQKLLLLITAIWISNVLKFTNHIRLSLFFFLIILKDSAPQKHILISVVM